MRKRLLSALFVFVIFAHSYYPGYYNSEIAYNYMSWRAMNNYYRPPIQHFRPLPQSTGVFYNPYMGYKMDLRPHPFGPYGR